MSYRERFSSLDIIGMLKHTSKMGLIGYEFEKKDVRPDGYWVLYYRRKYIVTAEKDLW